jgi:hypothetical protein
MTGKQRMLTPVNVLVAEEENNDSDRILGRK